MEKGIEEGIYQNKRRTALLALQQGMSIETIANITQLSKQQIQEILNEDKE